MSLVMHVIGNYRIGNQSLDMRSLSKQVNDWRRCKTKMLRMCMLVASTRAKDRKRRSPWQRTETLYLFRRPNHESKCLDVARNHLLYVYFKRMAIYTGGLHLIRNQIPTEWLSESMPFRGLFGREIVTWNVNLQVGNPPFREAP